MTNWVKVPAEVLRAAKNCRIVSRLGIGLDNIDVACCTELKIPVTNVPDYCLIEVAEHALALLLALSRKIGCFHAATKSGTYQLQAGAKLRRIEGQTLGLVGFGNIGQRLATKAHAPGLNILVTSRTPKEVPAPFRWLPLKELLQQSDYVSLHLPLTPESRHLINAESLKLFQPSAYLVNTSRGGLIRSNALAAACRGPTRPESALDVQDPEPPDLSQPLFCDPRVIVTPHAAFVSEESLENLRRRAAQQVADRLTGKTPESIVNGVAC